MSRPGRASVLAVVLPPTIAVGLGARWTAPTQVLRLRLSSGRDDLSRRQAILPARVRQATRTTEYRSRR
jgi:hypothetical protein